jgi:hypothetical protein
MSNLSATSIGIHILCTYVCEHIHKSMCICTYLYTCLYIHKMEKRIAVMSNLNTTSIDMYAYHMHILLILFSFLFSFLSVMLLTLSLPKTELL